MTVGILTEKSSAAKNFATALGGMRGNFNGVDYVISHARGHLYEFAQPEDMVPEDLKAKYSTKRWSLDNLPWDDSDFSWERVPTRSAGSVLSQIQRDFSGCDTLVLAGDIDPSGEGGLISWEIFEGLGLLDKTFYRMKFTDESVASLQKAFKDFPNNPIARMEDHDEYRMADFRSKWDLMSMQWTRAASVISRSFPPLRNGRLKSAMTVLVGDGLKAHKNYKKIPFFEWRFTDDHGVVYSCSDPKRWKHKSEVIGDYTESAVVVDKVTDKKTSPPKLINLADLSAALAPQGFNAKKVMDTYQKMYHDQVVSYPRTEDKKITPDQFSEMLPLVDDIARVVGVDPAVLTCRTPRKTHVATGGAHGANRPGPNVPTSLDGLDGTYGAGAKEIYYILARSFLTMLAEDYTYKQHKAHVEKYPEYTGIANVPVSLGWKDIFNKDADDEADDDSTQQGPGTIAQPFIYEGYPPRPPHPTQKWLMRQLDKHDVGTGATRTSTYAEVTGGKGAQLADKKGKTTLTTAGERNYHLIRGTRIAELDITKDVYAAMDRVAHGKSTAHDELQPISQWLMDDIKIMEKNMTDMDDSLRPDDMPEYAHGNFEGQDVKFKRVWAGHRFTDDEVDKLLAGETISFTANKKEGGTFPATGNLAHQEYNGHKYIGFKMDPLANTFTGTFQPTGEKVSFPKSWSGHDFNSDEVDKLLAGETIHVTAHSRKKKKDFECDGKLGKTSYSKTGWGFIPDFSK